MLMFAMHNSSKFAVSLDSGNPQECVVLCEYRNPKCSIHTKAFGSMQYPNIMINCDTRTIPSNFSKRKTFKVFVEQHNKTMLLAVPVFFRVPGWPAKKPRCTGKVLYRLLVSSCQATFLQQVLSLSPLYPRKARSGILCLAPFTPCNKDAQTKDHGKVHLPRTSSLPLFLGQNYDGILIWCHTEMGSEQASLRVSWHELHRNC